MYVCIYISVHVCVCKVTGIPVCVDIDVHFDFAVWSDVIYAKHRPFPQQRYLPLGPPLKAPTLQRDLSAPIASRPRRCEMRAGPAESMNWFYAVLCFKMLLKTISRWEWLILGWWRYLGLGWRLVEGYDLNGLIYVFFGGNCDKLCCLPLIIWRLRRLHGVATFPSSLEQFWDMGCLKTVQKHHISSFQRDTNTRVHCAPGIFVFSHMAPGCGIQVRVLQELQ